MQNCLLIPRTHMLLFTRDSAKILKGKEARERASEWGAASGGPNIDCDTRWQGARTA